MNKKIITQAIAVILFLFVLIMSLITLFSTVRAKNLAFMDYRFYIMESDAEPGAAKKGDLVIVKQIEKGNINGGDYVVYGSGSKNYYYCDEVIETKKQNTITKIIIAERNGIKYQFSENEISGKVTKHIYKLGKIAKFQRTPIGRTIFILFVICVFALLRILITLKKEDVIEYYESKKQEQK